MFSVKPPPKAVKARNITYDIAVRVQMGAILEGQKTISMIGVSIYCENSIEVSTRSHVLHRVSSMGSATLIRTSEAMSSIAAALTCYSSAGLHGQEVIALK